LVTDPLGNVTSCTYDAAGRKKSVTRANGQVVTFDSFDAMDRLLQSTAKQTPDPDAVTRSGREIRDAADAERCGGRESRFRRTQ